MPDLIVTNFNRNFTGVSSTAASVVRCQVDQYDLALAGHPLPGCPAPITKAQAATLSRTPPPGRPFTIWHVRRNPEMRTALWVRDVLRRPIRIVFTSAAIRRHSAFPRWLISRMDAVIATTEAAAGFVPHVRAVAPTASTPTVSRPPPTGPRPGPPPAIPAPRASPPSAASAPRKAPTVSSPPCCAFCPTTPA